MTGGVIKFGQVGEVVTTETDGNADVDASQSHTNNTTPLYSPTNEFDIFITSHKLNGDNYVQWSQSLLIHLAHRDKEGYINGDLPAPAQTESTYKVWKINDNLVNSWLINTMENIGELYLLHKITKYYDNCRRHGHICEECWGIHGRPTDQLTQQSQNKAKGKPKRGNLAGKGEEGSSSQDSFSKGQIELLEKMFTKFASSSTDISINLAASEEEGL